MSLQAAVTRLCRPAALVALALATSVPSSWAQSRTRARHPNIGGQHVIVAGWNYAAGQGMGETVDGYPEFRPNLRGWDFRINLPHVRWQKASSAAGGAAMVGVIEDTAHADETLNLHYVNNAIWLFQIGGDGVVRYKVLPSRRAFDSTAMENVTTLTGGWVPMIPPHGVPSFAGRPAAAVVGEGLGVARLFVAARAVDGSVYYTTQVLTTGSPSSWTAPWVALPGAFADTLSASPAYGRKLALAWGRSGQVHARLFDPLAGKAAWSADVALGAGQSPQALWDGVTLDVLYLGPDPQRRLLHRHAMSESPLALSPASVVSDRTLNTDCDAMAFNARLHVACSAQASPQSGDTEVWYSTSKTPFGILSAWTPSSSVGLAGGWDPQIAHVGDAIYVLALDAAGRLRYTRKDPHVPGAEWTGVAGSERWLQAGADVDPATSGSFFFPEALTFNADIYVTAARFDAQAGSGLHVVNFSRAAMKQFLEDRLDSTLLWGTIGYGKSFLADGDPFVTVAGTVLQGDFDGNGSTDFARMEPNATGTGPVRVVLDTAAPPWSSVPATSPFAKTGETHLTGDVDGALGDDLIRFAKGAGGDFSVTVALSDGAGHFGPPSTFHASFLEANTVPLVADVNGDGKADILSVALGAAAGPVKVALSNGTSFGTRVVFLASFARLGQMPMTGDFDGDGKGDLVLFGRVPGPEGPAPVSVALSTGSAFGSRTLWQTDLSPVPELPRVGDIDADGRADVLSFVRESVTGDRAQNVYLAASQGSSFGPVTMYLSRWVKDSMTPFIGTRGASLKSITGLSADLPLKLAEVYVADGATGDIYVASTFEDMSHPSGAPWERYKFFTDKSLGALMFPDWLWEVASCQGFGHEFDLIGASGGGSGALTILPTTPGSTEAHVQEELGHGVLQNCFTNGFDPFGMGAEILTTPIDSGGFDNDHPGVLCNATKAVCQDGSDATDAYCAPSSGPPPVDACCWLDCRDYIQPIDPFQHFFLRFINTYRLHGDKMRATIAAETDDERRQGLLLRYQWLKDNWFAGVEYKADLTPSEAARWLRGLQCLPGECPEP